VGNIKMVWIGISSLHSQVEKTLVYVFIVNRLKIDKWFFSQYFSLNLYNILQSNLLMWSPSIKHLHQITVMNLILCFGLSTLQHFYPWTHTYTVKPVL
jgi:hypothetical protein